MKIFLSVLFLILVLSCCTRQDYTTTQFAHNELPGQIDTQRLLDIDSEPGVWLTGGRDYQQSYYSPLDLISRENVNRLGYAWHYDIDTEHGFEATPIVVDGVMYGSGPTGMVFAVDARTGSELWKFSPDIDPAVMRKLCCGIVNRGVSVWKGNVYVGSVDGYLYALNAETGAMEWRVDTIADRGRGYSITGAPYIAKDLVVIGNSGAEFDARGYVTAYDAVTGEQRWRFFTVPGDPKNGFEHPELESAVKTWDAQSLWQFGLGGTVWDGMAYDPKLNLIYVGVGNAGPYPQILRSPSGGDNLFIASILAINPDTGRLVWHYQTTPGDSWDFTATQKMILADLIINGEVRQVIMQAPKNGFFYVLDRLSGELISAKPYAKVTWASHVDMESGRPVLTEQANYFDEPKLVFPSSTGAHNWQPMSYSPQSGFVYIPAIESGVVWAMPKGPVEYVRGGINTVAEQVYPAPGEWGWDSEVAKDLPPIEELGKGQPDTTIRGFLRAWNPVSQQLAWEQETSGPWVGDPQALWNGGGVMTTGGGLVFQGRGTGELVALDTETGEHLYSIDVGVSMIAAPMTYSVDGTQYIAILAGTGGAWGRTYLPGSAAYKYGNQGRLVTFKLGGSEVPKRAVVSHENDGFPSPPLERRGTPAQIELGADLFTRNCAKCHANIDARAAGIPDLRRMNKAAHEEFNDIVLKGTRVLKGMGGFSDILSAEDAEALHNYLIDAAWKSYNAEHIPSKPQAKAIQTDSVSQPESKL